MRAEMRRALAGLIALATMLCLAQPATAGQYPDRLPKTKIKRGAGHFVPIPDDVPHAEGVYVDNRIRDDLIWISKRFEIYVGEGYSGHLPGVGQVGCHCHVRDSDHKIGLAVDIYPVDWDGHGCDRSWRPLTKLAHLVEPVQDETVAPFRWVGYDGDDNHGCGDHLHLSWTHASDYKPGRASRWVETFRLASRR
jgi:hypothetical protein